MSGKIMKRLSEPFLSAYKKIEKLQSFDRYDAAFIFGSIARGDQNTDSDFDVIVIVNENNSCKEINHPIINGIKLDITFRSLKQVKEDNDKTFKKGEIFPMIAESIVVFDKTGKLTKYKTKFKNIKRRKAAKKDFQLIHFMLYHSDDKAKRNLESDKETALLALSININDILKFHYHIHGKWWLSNKRLLPDLRKWDSKMAKLVGQFVSTVDVNKKYKIWSKILDYVAEPIGGRKEIADVNCGCSVCRKDLELLQN